VDFFEVAGGGRTVAPPIAGVTAVRLKDKLRPIG